MKNLAQNSWDGTSAVPTRRCLPTLPDHPAKAGDTPPGEMIPPGDPVTRRWNGVREEFVSHSAEETIAFGRSLAGRIESPLLILLVGELGSGKTTLAKGIVSGLGGAAEYDVTSPSFTLVREYRGRIRLFHVDLYRVESRHDLETLGLEDLLAEEAVILVEWGEKLRPPVNVPTWRIDFEILEESSRHLLLAN